MSICQHCGERNDSTAVHVCTYPNRADRVPLLCNCLMQGYGAHAPTCPNSAPPAQTSAEQPQGEGLTPEREAEIRRIYAAIPVYRFAQPSGSMLRICGELLPELTRLRQQLAEAQRACDAWELHANGRVKDCLCGICHIFDELESRLQAAQGLVEKWRTDASECAYTIAPNEMQTKCADELAAALKGATR